MESFSGAAAGPKKDTGNNAAAAGTDRCTVI